MSRAANASKDPEHVHQEEAGTPASPPASAHNVEHEAVFPSANGSLEHFDEVKNSDIVGKAATIAVVGVGVALISAELLPGMLIGVAAAFLPGIGPRLRPFLKSTVRASYSAVRKTREMMAEASEQIQDAIAEAKTENVAPIPTPPPAPPATPNA